MHSTVGVGLNFAFRVTNPLNFTIWVGVGMANLLLYGFRKIFRVYAQFPEQGRLRYFRGTSGTRCVQKKCSWACTIGSACDLCVSHC